MGTLHTPTTNHRFTERIWRMSRDDRGNRQPRFHGTRSTFSSYVPYAAFSRWSFRQKRFSFRRALRLV